MKKNYYPILKPLVLTAFLSTSLAIWALFSDTHANAVPSSILMSMVVSICIFAERHQESFKRWESSKLMRLVIWLVFILPLSGGAMTLVVMS